MKNEQSTKNSNLRTPADEIDFRGFLGTPRFTRLKDKVFAVIKKAKEPLSVRDIVCIVEPLGLVDKRHLHNYLYEALLELEADDVVKVKGYVDRWRVGSREVVEVEKRKRFIPTFKTHIARQNPL